ncbi:AAA domain-containing protein [Pseudomonas aeruginosa]|uniref:AAA domain-containing protein n=1 Tax=Pseudomonas aeruginosa TaxID=287 RepID=UPI002E2B3C9E|nr:AAA domain-containing protein [Pseudomonas aeruginosa]
MITPFSDVIKEVSGGALTQHGVTTGTIHTMQGKEADVVILVLGGEADPLRSGAREWVVEKANMLNVAATRAKRRFYVIGDRADWAKRRHFDKIMDQLPMLNLEAALTRCQGAEEGGGVAQALLDLLRIGSTAPVEGDTSEGTTMGKLRVGLPAPIDPQ